MADSGTPKPPANTSRAKILEAVRQLLEVKSAQFFKVRDVAALAGVSPALVMRYFKSKDELVFEAIVGQMARRGTPQMLAWLGHHPHIDAEAFSVFLLRMDLAAGHRTRDLMSMQWWWSGIEEQRYREAIAPRAACHRQLLFAACGLDLDAQDPEIEHILHIFETLFVEQLRRAGVLRRSLDQAEAEWRQTHRLLSRAFAARAQTLKAAQA